MQCPGRWCAAASEVTETNLETSSYGMSFSTWDQNFEGSQLWIRDKFDGAVASV